MEYLGLGRAVELLGMGRGVVRRGIEQGELPVAAWAETARGGRVRPLVTQAGLEEFRQRLLVRWDGLPAFAELRAKLIARGPVLGIADSESGRPTA